MAEGRNGGGPANRYKMEDNQSPPSPNEHFLELIRTYWVDKDDVWMVSPTHQHLLDKERVDGPSEQMRILEWALRDAGGLFVGETTSAIKGNWLLVRAPTGKD